MDRIHSSLVSTSEPELESAPALPRFQPIRALVALGLTIGLMALLIREISRSPVSSEVLAEANLLGLCVALACMGAAIALSGAKWQIVLRGLGFALAFKPATRALLTAWPFAALTPSRAGDFVRSFLVRDTVPLLYGNTSVLIDRLLDVQSLVLLAFVGALYTGWWLVALALGGGLVLAWVVFAVLLARRSRLTDRLPKHKKWARTLELLLEALAQLGQNSKYLWSAGSLSMLTWIFVQLMFLALARSFDIPLSVWDCLTLWPMAILIGLVPLTLAGMGTRDLAYIWILGQAHQALSSDQETVLLVVTIAYTVVSSWIPALIGAPLAIRWLMFRRASSGA